MKKLLLIFYLFFLVQITWAQKNPSKKYLEKGKAEFLKDAKKQDYTRALTHLLEAVRLDPEDPEAHYYLGYAYSRLNANDGNSIPNMNFALTKACSEEMQEVTRLSPKYKKDLIVLDPYSKIMSEWGSLALKYWKEAKTDSLSLAFEEGRKRGGYSYFVLQLAKQQLDACNDSAVLIVNGDNITFPLYYVQLMEGYRKDVSLVNVSLLGTNWYPAVLQQRKIVPFDVPSDILDTLSYCTWSDSTMHIGRFSWKLPPTYLNQYLLRGDRILLSMLHALAFKRSIYFTMAFDPNFQLGLGEKLSSKLLIDELPVDSNTKPISPNDYYEAVKKSLSVIDAINRNSSDELRLIEAIRNNAFQMIANWNDLGQKKEAKRLFQLLDKTLPESRFPYSQSLMKVYAEHLRQLNK